jgi:UDP-N-acetylmuramyl-tripeptide synthetase
VVNVDDPKGADLEATLLRAVLDLWTYSCVRDARLRAHDIGYTDAGLRFIIAEGSERHELRTSLIGQYNVSNLLGVIGVMRALHVPLANAVAACADLLPVPGRMERLNAPGKPLVAVDYAHTPDALERVLGTARKITAGRLGVVFGCGGDRDRTKRPIMGEIAARLTDQTWVTSDNPRSERPEAILDEIVVGVQRVAGATARCARQADRRAAIAAALGWARAGDTVVIAGKGHETYQIVGGDVLDFDDRAVAREILGRGDRS